MSRLFVSVLLILIMPVLLFAKDYKTVTYTTTNAGQVIFNHDPHLQKLGNNCTLCHNAVYSISGKNPRVSMAEMAKGKSCGTCHNKTRAFGLTDCARCHLVKEVPIEIANFGTVTFSHNFHLGMYSCGDCHNKLFKPGPGNPRVSMVQMEKGAACGACHDGKTAFTVKGECSKCHTVKEIPFAASAAFSHKFHLQMYQCGNCHNKVFVAGPAAKRSTMKEMEQGKSCGACHDGKSGFSVKGDCGKCHQGTMKDVTFKATDALFSHVFHLGMYKCGDCHSGIFVGGVGAKRYSMADMAQGKSCGACHDGSTGFAVSGSCGKCHKSTRDIAFAIKDAGTVSFSHALHTGMYKCDDCHNKVFATGVASKRYSMADMAKGKSCGACHDGKTAFSATTAANCGKCHPAKEITFVDDARFSHTKHLEMYSCGECHSKIFLAGPDNKRWTMPDMEKGKSCGACHNGSSGFSVKGDCDKCHKSTSDVPFKNAQTGVTVFSHKLHLGMYKCGDCHNGIFTTGVAAKRFTMAAMEKGKSCGACHDGKTGFSVKQSCDRCHPTRELSFKEAGAIFSHKFHLGMYKCADCHPALFTPGAGAKRFTMADMDKGKSCGACHDGSTAFKSSGSCDKCHKVTRAIKFSQLPGKAGDVLFSHKLHLGKGYSCSDCHNKIFGAGVARKHYRMKEMEQGKSCGACHGFSMAFNVKEPANCERCHQPKR